MSVAKTVMGRFYKEAEGDPERLPWHRDTPSAVLISAVDALGGRGRALDLGCGAGIFSVWLAARGLEVTGIDLFPEAIAMAESLAAKRDAPVDFREADLFSYGPEKPFDLVYDSGCLHSLVGGDVSSYKDQLLRWVAPNGSYVLEHWGKRHALDWRPIGPRRRTQASIRALFAPELQVAETEVNDFKAPLPFGPTVRGVGYWFRRNA